MPGSATLEAEPQSAAVQDTFMPANNQLVWDNWNGQYCTLQISASTNFTINQVWTGWNQNFGGGYITVNTGGNVTNANVWGSWNNQYSVTIIPNSVGYGVNGWTANETPEQKKAREEAYAKQQAEYEARRKKEEEELNAARARARELLLRHLNEKQREEYETKKQFHVTSQEGNIYRIEYGWTRNVRKLDKDGQVVQNFCIHPAERIPEEDNLLAQKLMLECCEKEFVRIANKS